MALQPYQPKKMQAQRPQPQQQPVQPAEEELLLNSSDEQLLLEFTDERLYRIWTIKLQARLLETLKRVEDKLDNLAIAEVKEGLEFPEYPTKK